MRSHEEMRDVLVKARSLIEKPEAWTRENMARDTKGSFVSPLSSTAVCFCSIGAVVRAVMESPCLKDSALETLRPFVPEGRIATFNDDPTTTHADVLAVFDKAISELSA